MGRRISDAQRLAFAQQWLMGSDATSAYRLTISNAGNRLTAKKEAWQLLHAPKTQAALTKLREELYAQTSSDLNEWLASNLRPIRFDPARAFDDDGNYLPIRDMDHDTRACIEAVELEEERIERRDEDGVKLTSRTNIRKVKFRSRDGAEDRVGKALGAYQKDNTQRSISLFDALPREVQRALYERLTGGSGS